MPDQRLIRLLAVIAFLNVLHLLDHVFRGDFHWSIDEQSVGFLVVATVILGGMGLVCGSIVQASLDRGSG
ncbi:MAG: hypothetical protein A4E19_19545 [Nitrospira sp. SG-bin1]|nr:MAG: hypothetical protein A4E19_19545 [Nitrospira sp. SG-bin1]